MDDKLKACPRCGREQWTDKERGDTIPYQKKMRRRCDWCDLETRDWNNRPIEDDLRAVIGSLRRQVGILKQHYSNAIKTQDEFRGLYDTAQEEIERLQKAEKALEYVAYQYKTERDAARAINSETLSPESDTQPDLSIKGGTQGGAQ